jgi:hypothetical protein
MDNLIVSRHAMDRYRECVADLSDHEIFARLSGPAFELAAEIGAPFVKLPTGHRAVIRDATVITILHADCSCGLLDPRRDPHPAQEHHRSTQP